MINTLLRPTPDDLRAMVRLAVPVVTVQVGMMLMGVVDTMIVGRVSAGALAAVALGNLYVISVTVFGIGTLLALDPLVAQAVGAGESSAVVRAVHRGLAIAVCLTVPSSLALIPGELLLGVLRQPGDIVPTAAAYARLCIPGVLPFFVFVVLRQTLQAMKRLRPVVITIIVVNAVNVLLDIVLVFGVGEWSGLGVLGSAWATTVCRWLLVVFVAVAGRRELAVVVTRPDPDVWQAAPLWRMFRLGAPIGMQLELEIAAFQVIALLMGWLGTVEMAAHQVAINLASLTFMVPLGVSAAASVHVGHAVGRGDDEGARRAASAALACGTAFMTVSAVLLVAFPGWLARAYTSVEAVHLLAASLIPIAGFFQIFDGLQVVSAGVLRGLADTRAPLVVNLLGFWLIGVPASLGLAFGFGLGPVGLWWGLVVGLGTVAGFLFVRVTSRLRRPLARVQVDR